jgi:hypothetical protein
MDALPVAYINVILEGLSSKTGLFVTQRIIVFVIDADIQSLHILQDLPYKVSAFIL